MSCVKQVRKLASTILCFAPSAALWWLDRRQRGAFVAKFPANEVQFYNVSAALSATLIACLVLLAVRERGGLRWFAHGLLVLAAAVLVGSQQDCFRRYQAFIDHTAILSGTTLWPPMWEHFRTAPSRFFASYGLPLLTAVFLPLVLRRLRGPEKPKVKPPRYYWDLGIIAALAMAFIAPNRGARQGMVPEALYLSGLGQGVRAHWDHNETVRRIHPGPRIPVELPQNLIATPARKRSVLFVVNESVRFASVCTAYGPDCPVNPFSNAAAKDRIPFMQMRAMDSTTTISIGVMWTGLLPTASREEMTSAPLIWEYAHAANIPTAYWTSQNVLFGNQGRWVENLPLDKSVNATQLEENASLDAGAEDTRLFNHVIAELPTMPDPFFGVVHLSNTHYPYLLDDKDAPFQPETDDSGPINHDRLLNRYHDAIYHQDRGFGRLIDAVHASGRPITIVYISDHGEQMHEHGPHGHTGSLHEQEVHVPAWIDTPSGTLTGSEHASLVSLRDRALLSIDVMPTLLDLLGLLDNEKLGPFRRKMAGESLLRGGSPENTPRFITNCMSMWGCSFQNWGAIAGTRKLIAHQSNAGWRCFDVRTDPEETHDLPTSACADLVPIAETALDGYGKTPF